MDKQTSKKQKNYFAITTIWLVGLGILAFIGFRSILQGPVNNDRVYFVYTRLNGYQDQILTARQYYISWQNLLPGNVLLEPVDNRVQELYINKKYSLPSAGNYQMLLPKLDVDFAGTTGAVQQNPFEYQLEMTLQYRLRPEELLAVLQNSTAFAQGFPLGAENSSLSELAIEEDTENNQQEAQQFDWSWAPWAGYFERKLKQRLNQELETLFSGEHALIPSGLHNNVAELEQYWYRLFERAFPQLELLSIDVRHYRQADLELYAIVQKNYQELLQQISSKSLERLLQQQNNRIAQELELQNIERLGEIINKYPLLIQYFAVNQDIEIDKIAKSPEKSDMISSQIGAALRDQVFQELLPQNDN